MAQANSDSGAVRAQMTKRLGGYELISKVGRGGMGVVYKARQLSMNRIVAIKILAPRLARDAEYIRRFIREAQAVGRLNHRNIVQGLEAGEADGFYYFAMEFVDGETVHQMIMRDGALNETLALNIARDVARALSHAHKVGLVHRDIKPGNIMLTRGGVTKLCDLGLAREKDRGSAAPGRQHVAVGTPYYISPEQALGQDNADIRSDIYSLGATLYRMVVGEPPFDGDSPGQILRKHVEEPLPWPSSVNPEVSDHTSHLIARMMAKDPAERYQTPAELQEDVERVLAGEAPLSAGVKFELPAPRPAAAPPRRSRGAQKKEALRAVYELRLAAKEAAQEQRCSIADLLDHLKGNLDEKAPQTHLKYAILLLTENEIERAREQLKVAARLGADVSGLIARLSALAVPAGMVYVPPGPARLGAGADAGTAQCDGFYVDVRPVTNRDYARFLAANRFRPPAHWKGRTPPEGAEDLPVVGVSWDDARAYALWAGKDLPTSLQWLRAARGEEARLWPWGDEFDPSRANVRESGKGGPTPVGEYPAGASPFGCLDMAGNVWQWLADPPEAAAGPDERQAAGGSWDDPKEEAQCCRRRRAHRTTRDAKTGFRCVRPL